MSGPPHSAPPPGGAADGLAQLSGLKLGNYRLERLVGQGRMGAVYLAQDEALLRPTAVKVLSWRKSEAQGHDPVQWFLAEARLVARINDPRVIQIYGAARQGEHCYIAMEYVPGRSAGAVVERDGPLSPELATEVLVQAAAALAAAHRSGVVHRDVKPANLLLGPGGIAKLGDFGMALGLDDQRPGNAHLRVGTPLYTAPEIWRGEAAGPSADLYSLGATYYQLLTGAPPFPGADAVTLEEAHQRAPIPDPRQRVPGVPAACAALVQRALAKSPRDRQASAQELGWEGRRILQELAAAAPPDRRRAALARPEAAPVSPVLPPWARALGFARRPFADPDPLALPYQGQPFAGLHALLTGLADDPAAVTAALTGPEGAGRTTAGRRLSAELAPTRLVVQADLAGDPGGQALVRRLGRALGGGEGGHEEGSVAAVVERLEEASRKGPRRPLLVVDAVLAEAPPPLVALLRAAEVTRAFKVVLLGAPGLGAALQRSGGAREVREIPLAPLTTGEVLAYVRSWLAATRDRQARPLLFSPDALLLLARRAAGLPGRVDRLAENALVLAAAGGARTITSFHAWAAPERERWAALPAAALPRRPEGWPTDEARAVLDECRRAGGLRPWPRQGGQGRGAEPSRSGTGS